MLFDNTKNEQAGNADWVVFAGAEPDPAHPERETDWRGGLSAWGFALHRTGRYEVATLPPGGRITFADPSNAADLSRFHAYVVPEPNNHFSDAEAKAIEAWVRAGGGLFIIADHKGADRDRDGVDAVKAWNRFFDVCDGAFGIRFNADDVTSHPDDNLLDDPSSPLLHGAFGHVRATTYYNGATMLLEPHRNASARALIWKRGSARDLRNVTFAVSQLGAGRVAAVGDSSPADDGTGAGRLFDGWNDPHGDNAALFLNATAWLAGDAGP